MLPFIDDKKTVSTIMARRGGKDLEIKPEVDQDLNPSLKSAAEDVMRAIESKSAVDLAKALKAAFEICDSEPHEEGSV